MVKTNQLSKLKTNVVDSSQSAVTCVCKGCTLRVSSRTSCSHFALLELLIATLSRVVLSCCSRRKYSSSFSLLSSSCFSHSVLFNRASIDLYWEYANVAKRKYAFAIFLLFFTSGVRTLFVIPRTAENIWAYTWLEDSDRVWCCHFDKSVKTSKKISGAEFIVGGKCATCPASSHTSFCSRASLILGEYPSIKDFASAIAAVFLPIAQDNLASSTFQVAREECRTELLHLFASLGLGVVSATRRSSLTACNASSKAPAFRAIVTVNRRCLASASLYPKALKIVPRTARRGSEIEYGVIFSISVFPPKDE